VRPARAVLSAIAGLTAAAAPLHAAGTELNHLAGEKSPYLLQHVTNPVDWYPWGEEAFAKAKRENKPIFLSIGYSTCHWCHVMERESFTNEAVAEILNSRFVSIKVDREERPDIDKIYMTAANGAGWGGGWPLSIWMTPDRKPFYGGTYFPPNSQWGRPGFSEVLERISGLWEKDGDRLQRDADRLAAALKEHSAVSKDGKDLSAAWLDGLFDDLGNSFDGDNGGFGGRPKFPMPVNIDFLLRYYARSGESKALEMASATLEAMARGGIYDHVGGGFARYSVDDQWRIPHFEKMLYDNAQLAATYLEGYRASGDARFAGVAKETLEYLLRDMAHPDGGFYSAEDADSLPAELAEQGVSGDGHENKSEGAFYLWTLEEVQAALGKTVAEVYAFRYGVEASGNAVEDPHGEFTGKNILYEAHTLSETAERFGRSEGELRRLFRVARKKLLEARGARPRPGLDDKVLASWNGLALSAFAKAYQILEEPRYLKAAEKAAAFLFANLYDEKTKTLYHRWRDGERKVSGMSDDYAFVIQGLLDLYEASFDPAHLLRAETLAERLQSDFFDGDGGYFMTASGEGRYLLARVIEDSDNVEPAASSVAASALLRLSQLAGRDDFRTAAEKTLRRFGAQMEKAPRSLPRMVVAVGEAEGKPRQIVIAGGLAEPETIEMLRLVNRRPMPARAVMVLTPEHRGELERRSPQLKGMVPIGGKPTAYLCVNFSCELPTNDVGKVAQLLDRDSKIRGK
jgi:uncharacterized protein YyaL (SSP411 family)